MKTKFENRFNLDFCRVFGIKIIIKNWGKILSTTGHENLLVKGLNKN